jgi:hypothetical protein
MFDEAPPISFDDLQDLFRFLNESSAAGYQCDHRYTLAERFLRSRGLPVESMIAWLGYNGAGCDCEIIFNTAENWADRMGFETND